MKKILFILPIAVLFINCSKKSSTISFGGVEYDRSFFDSAYQMPLGKSSPTMINLNDPFSIESPTNVVGKTFDFSTLIDSYELIFLETIDSSMIGEVSRVIRKDHFIFVLDSKKSNRLFVFDNSGKFIRNIGAPGNGPGEYYEASDFDYDYKKGVIYIWDNYKTTIYEYDTLGIFLSKRKVPVLSMYFTRVGEEFIFQNILGNNHSKMLSNHALCIGTEKKPISKVCLPILKYNFISDRISRINDSTALFTKPYNDTIYHYRKGQIFAEYVFNFPNSTRLPDDHMIKSNCDYDRFKSLFPRSKYTYFDYGCWESSNYLITQIVYKDIPYTIYFNKITGALHIGNKTLNSSDRLERMLVFSNPISVCDDCFITPVYFPFFIPDIQVFFRDYSASEKKSLFRKYPQFEHWNQESNPILCFIKYKSLVSIKN